MTQAVAPSIPECVVTSANFYAQPVVGRFGNVVEWLCFTEMPNGKILVTWIDYSDQWGLVLDNMEPLLEDYSIDGWTEGTIIPYGVGAGAAPLMASCFTVGADVYVHAYSYSSFTGKRSLDILKAVNPADPLAGWTLHSNLKEQTYAGGNFASHGALGVPMVTPGGNWILPTKTWTTGSGVLSSHHSTWVSTDAGVSWDEKFAYNYWIGASNLDGACGQVGHHAGRYYTYSWGAVSPGKIAYSDDEGDTWNLSDIGYGSEFNAFPVVNDGTNYYTTYISGTPDPHLWDTGHDGIPLAETEHGLPGLEGTHAELCMFRAIWVPSDESLYYTLKGRYVAASASKGGWSIGTVRMA